MAQTHTLNDSKLRWTWPLHLLALGLVTGIAIAGYLTYHHENELYGDSSVTLGNCPETQTINCEIVNSSAYSEMFGVPIALFAIPTYLLLLGLIYFRRRYNQALHFAFGIGLLTVAYSMVLAYLSHFKVGYLCLWCIRLYAINLSIPLLIGLALWKNPFPDLIQALRDVSLRSPTIRFGAAVFVGLMALSITSQRIYRSTLTRVEVAKKSTANVADSALWENGAFKLPGELQLASLNSNGRMSAQPFDLQSKIGKGKPIALVFISPGMYTADEGGVHFIEYFKKSATQFELYAVAGVKEDYKPETVWELYRSFPQMKDVPLLYDRDFQVSTALGTNEVPAVTLIDGNGTLIASRVRTLNGIAAFAPRKVTGKEIIDSVSSGDFTQFKGTASFNPSQELFGKCAPSFTLTDLLTGRPYAFQGKSKNNKPTFLVFWSATCKHCQKEIPLILEHYKANPGQYNLVSVSNIRPDKKDGTSPRKFTEKYAKNLGINFPILVDSGAVSNLFRVNSTPTTLLISADGTIREGWYHVHSDIDKAFKTALRDLASTGKACEEPSKPIRPTLSMDFVSPEGKKVALGSLLGQPTLLHFWATWCGPCQEELPGLLKFSEKAQAKGVKLVLVSVEDAEDGPKIARFLEGYGKKWKSYREPSGGIASEINMGYSVPRTFFLNEKGQVLRSFYGAQKWDEENFADRALTWLQWK